MSYHHPVKLKHLQVFLSSIGIGLLLALVLRWFQAPDLNAQRMQILTQHPLIQVYTNHNPATSYREPYRKQTRLGDNLEQIIVEQIQQARSSIEVAVQELRSPLIAQALRDRHQAGVRVRVVIENTYSRPWSSITPAEVQKMDTRMQGRYRENIRLIDRNGDGKLSPDEIDNNDALQVLRKASIPYLDDTADGSAGSGLMHHKFVVIDGQRVIVTSANFTMSDLHGDFSPKQSLGNANSLVVLQSPAIATLFTKEFDILWGDGPGGKLDSQFGIDKPFRPAQTIPLGDATVSVKFSPTPAGIPWEFSSNGLISTTLGKSRKTIDLALFVFSDQQIANQLETVVQKGASLRVLIEPTFAFQYYSEALDLLGVALPIRLHKVSNHPEEPTQALSQSVSDKTCRAELENHPWSHPIQTVGVAKLPPGDLLHHKFGVVDRQTVIIGSHNWTEAADRQNDETLLVIEHPTIAAHYEREYERLWANSSLGLPAKISENTQKMQQNCRPSKAEASSFETNSPEISTAKVNLNTATLQELEQLPGVGPKLAKRILVARQNQSFQSLADLDRVPGVGKRVLREIGDRVTW
jgi:competence ComEA-like helix-hairpin-helix protein